MSESPPKPTRYDAHPYEADASAGADAPCAVCGERRASILHHPTRVRAARAVAEAKLREEGSGDP